MPSVTAGRMSEAKLFQLAGMIQSTLSPAPMSGSKSSLSPKNHCMKRPSTKTGMPQMMSAAVVSVVSQNVYWRRAE